MPFTPINPKTMQCSSFECRAFVFFALVLSNIYLVCPSMALAGASSSYLDELDTFGEGSDRSRVSINTLADLAFGAFYPGRAGGIVEVSKDGIRSSSGSVVLIGSDMPVSAAVYEIRSPGFTMIHLMFDDQIILRGPGSEQLICTPIVNGQNTTIVSPSNAARGFTLTMGARLIVEGAGQSPPGDYSGVINVFLVVE